MSRPPHKHKAPQVKTFWRRFCIEVAYIVASVKAIAVKFLDWEKTTRKGLRLLELTSKVTTEFAYNSTSRGLHKERYCRIDVISELKCM